MSKEKSILEATTVVAEDMSLGKIELSLQLIQVTGAKRQTINHESVSDYIVVALTGAMWDVNARGNFIEASSGQIADQLLCGFDQFPVTPVSRGEVERIVELWDRWHLNNLNAGCVHQNPGSYSDPEIAGQMCEHSGYKYGSAWLVEVVPPEVVAELRNLFVEVE